MSNSFQNSFLHNLVDDIRHFLRSPGLIAVTSVTSILILLFIVFPIGSVLIRSFSVTFPTVTVQCQHSLSTNADAEKRVTQPILAALKPI